MYGTNGISAIASHQLVKKIASTDPSERMAATTRIDKVLLERAVTTGIARRYFKGLSATDTEGEGMRVVTKEDKFYDDLVHEKPGVVYYLQPDPKKEIFAPRGRGAVIGMDAQPVMLTFAGERYVESFERISSQEFTKSVKDLYVYPYDIVTFFENHSHKDLMDVEDNMFFRLQNYLLYIGRETLAGKNIQVANKDTFSIFLFSTLKDLHKDKQVPFSRLLTHFSILNEKERTVASEIEQVSLQGINGETVIDTIFGLTPLTLETKEYCYYSFNKANEALENEEEQFFIDLDTVEARNVAEFAAIADETERNDAAEVIRDYMEQMGYKFTAMTDIAATALYGAGYEFARFLDADNFFPRIPVYGEDYEEETGGGYGKDIVAIIGKTMMRNIILTPRAYFGHFDLFEEDAKTFVERSKSNIVFSTEEEAILTAKNERAVTVLDIWEPVLPYTGS